MNKYIFAVIVFTCVVSAGCKKTDNAAKWVGTYTSTGTVYDSINQITISEVNSSTVKIEVFGHYGSFLFTYGTIEHATVQSATSLTYDETDTLNYVRGGGPYLVQGGGTLGGNNITLTGTATNSLGPIPFGFIGSK